LRRRAFVATRGRTPTWLRKTILSPSLHHRGREGE
jgi:hypothetical protein